MNEESLSRSVLKEHRGNGFLARRFCRSWFSLALPLLLLSCSHPTASAYLETARKAETEARAAFEHHDLEAANLAAARAEVALADLERLRTGKAPPAEGLVHDTRTAAATARNYAQLVFEESLRIKKLAALKLKAYQGLRGGVCSYGLAGLATVADQLARFGTNSSSAVEQQIAAFARTLAEVVEGRSASSNTAPDWAGIAANLRAWGTNPPPSLGMVLALGFTAAGMTDFALCEIESVDPSNLSATNRLSWYHLERGGLLALQGWDRSAARELEQALALTPQGWNGLGTAQATAIFHFWLADHALQRGHHQQAEIEIDQARKSWPDSPLVALLAGEKLAANGQWERAADLLEVQAATVTNTWFAQRMSVRARELREGRGKASSLFSNPGFIVELASQVIGEKMAESAAKERIQQFLSGAKAFGERVAEKLPGIGN
jgi:hypothetical protein